MPGEVRAVLIWTGFLGALTGLLVGLADDWLPVLLAAASTAASLALAAWLWARRPLQRASFLVPDSSYATMAVALGAGGALAGVAWGLWLTYMGAGLAVLGLGGLVREARAARRVS